MYGIESIFPIIDYMKESVPEQREMTPAWADSVASGVDGEPLRYTQLIDFAPCIMQYIRFITRSLHNEISIR